MFDWKGLVTDALSRIFFGPQDMLSYSASGQGIYFDKLQIDQDNPEQYTQLYPLNHNPLTWIPRPNKKLT